MPLSKMQEMLKGPNFALFDGYEKVEVTYLNIGPAFSTNPNAPQGTVAKVSGGVTYKDGYTGQFQAVLEQENKEWKIHNINVTAPPKKFEDYLKSNQ